MSVGMMRWLYRWLYAKPHDAMVDIRWAVMEWRADRENPVAFLDPLLGSAALIVERNNPLGRTAQVGDDEADAGIQFP